MEIPKPLNSLNNLNALNPLVFADILFRKDKRVELFLGLSNNKRIELLRKATLHVKRDILTRIPDEDLVKILETVDPDEATDILQQIPKAKREKALLLLNESVKSSLSTLLEFDANTAAGLMTLDYVQAKATDDIASVAKQFKLHEQRTGRPPRGAGYEG